MTKKKFLNVEYSVYKTRINVTGMGELSDVRRAIKAEFGEAIPVAPALIQLYFNSTREQLITDLDEITPEDTPQYYQKLTQVGLAFLLAPRLHHQAKAHRLIWSSDQHFSISFQCFLRQKSCQITHCWTLTNLVV